MTACIHLVRHCAHGDVGRVLTGRRPGVPLSDEGRAHAARVAEDIAARDSVAAIYASPRERTQETATIIADRLGLRVGTAAALDEVDFGDWTGRSFAELDGDAGWQHWNAARSLARAPNGEAMGEAVARAVAYLEAIAASAPVGPVMCVTHCDIIRGVIAHYLGLDLDRLLRFDVDPGSVSTLVVGDWGGKVTMMNRCVR